MTRNKERLLDEALSLPEGDRADLAAKLIESLDGEPDADVDMAWAEEIERRCAAVSPALTPDYSQIQKASRRLRGLTRISSGAREGR